MSALTSTFKISILKLMTAGCAVAALSGCLGLGLGSNAEPAAPVVAAPPAEPAPAAPDFGQMFAGPLGAAVPLASRPAAYAALSAALNSGRRQSWKGEHGTFGYFAPTGDAGTCRAFSAVTYQAGRPQSIEAKACKSDQGDWRAS
jgi:hypothetical protein